MFFIHLFNLSSFLIFYIIQIDFEWHVAYGIDDIFYNTQVFQFVFSGFL